VKSSGGEGTGVTMLTASRCDGTYDVIGRTGQSPPLQARSRACFFVGHTVLGEHLLQNTIRRHLPSPPCPAVLNVAPLRLRPRAGGETGIWHRLALFVTMLPKTVRPDVPFKATINPHRRDHPDEADERNAASGPESARTPHRVASGGPPGTSSSGDAERC
jgi:hypothetical protein